jgi:hypothetical protein
MVRQTETGRKKKIATKEAREREREGESGKHVGV